MLKLKPQKYGAQDTPELEPPPVDPIWWYAEALAPTSHGVTNTFIWTRMGFDARAIAERVLRLEWCNIRLIKCEDHPQIFSKEARAASRMARRSFQTDLWLHTHTPIPALSNGKLNGKSNGR